MFLKRLLIITAVFTSLLVAAIVLVIFAQLFVFLGPLPGTGDPDNLRLNELANDAVFSILPPNSKLNGSMIKTPAKYTKPGFDAGGWRGPSVEISFMCGEPEAVVYQFYAERAIETSWQPHNRDSDGIIYSWTKTYSNGALANLILYGPDESKYKLVAGVPAILK